MKRALILLAACSSPKPSPWLTDEAAAFKRARETHRDVLIDFMATWSVPSDQTSRVLDKLRPELDKRYVALRIDISNEDERFDEAMARYKTMLPAVIVITTDGTVKKRITAGMDEITARESLLE